MILLLSNHTNDLSVLLWSFLLSPYKTRMSFDSSSYSLYSQKWECVRPYWILSYSRGISFQLFSLLSLSRHELIGWYFVHCIPFGSDPNWIEFPSFCRSPSSFWSWRNSSFSSSDFVLSIYLSQKRKPTLLVLFFTYMYGCTVSLQITTFNIILL